MVPGALVDCVVLAPPEHHVQTYATAYSPAFSGQLRRQRLVDARTRLINELRWQLHDLWPEWEIPKGVLIGAGWQQQVAGRLQRSRANRARADRHRRDPPHR